VARRTSLDEQLVQSIRSPLFRSDGKDKISRDENIGMSLKGKRIVILAPSLAPIIFAGLDSHRTPTEASSMKVPRFAFLCFLFSASPLGLIDAMQPDFGPNVTRL
jgi:hypothetical protein